jgi:two-component system, sensor histidine kinase and response regulator
MKEKKPLILIVDDVSRNLKLLGSILYEKKYEIAMADSGKEALRILQEISPDLILLDIMMPEMDGYEVCKVLKENESTASIPVIFLTAKSEADHIVKGFEYGAADYITKPFNAKELLSRVATHIDLKLRSEELLSLNNNLEKIVISRTEELAEAKARLEKLDKSKTYFLSLLAHELNTPINEINGFTNLLKSSMSDEEDLESLHYIDLSVSRLKKYADLSSLLTRLKAEKYEFQFEEYRLDNLIDEVIFEMKDYANSCKVRFNVNMCTNCKNIRYDHFLIKKAFYLIIENAIKHSPDNGIVHITGTNTGKEYIVKIQDQGNGFSPDSLETLFELFTSDEIMHHKEGFGLGLATVKIIIDSHQGRIFAKNLENNGAEIILCFNLSENNDS